MDKFPKYMVLKLTSGGLMYEHLNVKTDPKNPVIKKIMEDENVGIGRIKRGHNLKNPIPYTTLSNMLISLMGGVPVPTKPSRLENFGLGEITRYPVCDEMAKNSFYELKTPIDPDRAFVKQVLGEDGEYYSIVEGSVNGTEFMQSEKSALNSNVSVNTVLFTDKDGNEVKVTGSYNYGMLLRLFDDDENNPAYKRLFSFINEQLGVEDVRKTYTFAQMAYEFYKKSFEEGYNEKIGEFFDEMKVLWDGRHCIKSWFYAIFHYGEGASGNTSNNETVISSETYLRNRRGDKIAKISVNGHIIVPIPDERTLELLKNGKGYCTFLDGGIATIEMLGVEKYRLPDKFETEWKNISSEEPMQLTEKESLA